MAKSKAYAKVKLEDGKEVDLKDFFYANYPVFCSFATKYIASPEICEDIVQDIFVKILEGQQVFSDICSVQAFFYKSIRNSCFDYIKHEKVKDKYVQHNIHNMDNAQTFWDEIVKQEAYKIVYEEINKLPEMGRKVLLLSLSGKDNEYIAQELGISVNTVKTHKSRSYKMLRKSLGGLFFFLLYNPDKQDIV
ncbi:MAG: RNA polymerase sigma-70 factor [Bacteroidales bacterium]